MYSFLKFIFFFLEFLLFTEKVGSFKFFTIYSDAVVGRGVVDAQSLLDSVQVVLFVLNVCI